MKVGWSETTIGEIARIARGGSPRPIQKFLTKDPDGINWIKIGDATKSGKYIFETEEKIIPEGVARSRLVKDGDFLLSNSMSFGRPYILKTTGCIHDGWLVLTPDLKRVDQDYLYHLLGAPQVYAQFDQLAAGSTVRNLNTSLVSTVRIPLPPLDEQKRIVAVLDEALEGLSRARTNAEANVADARELFTTFVAANFLSNAMQGAVAATLGDICTIQSGAGFPEKYQGKTEGKHPFYKVSDMNLPGNEWELLAANNYISEEVRKTLRAAVLPNGAIAFPKVGGAIATNKKRIVAAAGCVDNNVMGLIPDEGKVEPKYLHEWLRAFNIYDFSNKANPPSITQGTVSAWPISLPSRKEQVRIVAAAEALRNQTQGLEAAYSECLSDLDRLRQSLMQKAFSGELT